MGDVDVLVPLFDAYRQFYRQQSDPGGARQFLRARLENKQSVVLPAHIDSVAAGFTQLYPSFSSGAMARIFVLNDLFVVPEACAARAARPARVVLARSMWSANSGRRKAGLKKRAKSLKMRGPLFSCGSVGRRPPETDDTNRSSAPPTLACAAAGEHLRDRQ
jgi:hypothetical protein